MSALPATCEPGRPARLALVGMRGVGKTTVGALLASRLGLPFVDTDREVERQLGASVRDIFATHGEPAFRRVEREAVLHALAGPRCVVATGGGSVLDPWVREAMRRQQLVVWLRVEGDPLRSRLTGEARPSLTGGGVVEEAEAVAQERAALYAEVCHVQVRTDDRTPEEVADVVQCLWRALPRHHVR